MNILIFKTLVKIANKLDAFGLHKEASYIDNIIKTASNSHSTFGDDDDIIFEYKYDDGTSKEYTGLPVTHKDKPVEKTKEEAPPPPPAPKKVWRKKDLREQLDKKKKDKSTKKVKKEPSSREKLLMELEKERELNKKLKSKIKPKETEKSVETTTPTKKVWKKKDLRQQLDTEKKDKPVETTAPTKKVWKKKDLRQQLDTEKEDRPAKKTKEKAPLIEIQEKDFDLTENMQQYLDWALDHANDAARLLEFLVSNGFVEKEPKLKWGVSKGLGRPWVALTWQYEQPKEDIISAVTKHPVSNVIIESDVKRTKSPSKYNQNHYYRKSDDYGRITISFKINRFEIGLYVNKELDVDISNLMALAKEMFDKPSAAKSKISLEHTIDKLLKSGIT
jgi:hypothetical protein